MRAEMCLELIRRTIKTTLYWRNGERHALLLAHVTRAFDRQQHAVARPTEPLACRGDGGDYAAYADHGSNLEVVTEYIFLNCCGHDLSSHRCTVNRDLK